MAGPAPGAQSGGRRPGLRFRSLPVPQPKAAISIFVMPINVSHDPGLLTLECGFSYLRRPEPSVSGHSTRLRYENPDQRPGLGPQWGSYLMGSPLDVP